MTVLTTHTSTQNRLATDAPILYLGGLAMALLILPLSLAMTLDARMLEGVSIWVKPLKFAASLTLYLLTLAYFARFAPAAHNTSRRTTTFHGIVMLCVIGEMLWIGGAAMYGTTSHFNTNSLMMSAIYGIMGAFAVTLTSASLVLGLAILRTKPTGLVQSIGASLIATFVLTCLTAGYMSSTQSHFVGGTTEDLLPIMGWARDIGDLRVAHFFATHIMHFAPAIALVAFALGRKGRTAMILPTLLVSAFTLLTFAQALNGRPFLLWLS